MPPLRVKKLEELSGFDYKDGKKKFHKSQDSELEYHNLVIQTKTKYSDYIVKKIKQIIIESTHYSSQKINNNTW